MHLCTAIAAQVTKLQSLKERVLACASGVQTGTATRTDVATIKAEFITCKTALHELRLNTPEYLRMQLGIPSGTEVHEWDYKLHINRIMKPRWRKNAEGYIENLNLDYTAITDAELALLPLKMKEMDLSGCQNIEAPNLCKYPSLTIVNFYDSTITDAGLRLLPINVREMRLYGCKKIEAPDLRKYSNLAKLDLGYTAITDAWLALLPTNVTKLYLEGCENIKEPNLHHCTKLKKIHLGFSSITDAGLALLPTSVTQLCLYECKKITKEGITALQARLPHCKITCDYF